MTMKKKLLEALPFPEITDTELVQAGPGGVDYAMQEAEASCGGETVMVIPFRTFSQRWTRDRHSFLSGRTFIWKDGWVTLMECTDGTIRWSRREPYEILSIYGDRYERCREMLNHATERLTGLCWYDFCHEIRRRERAAREEKAVRAINSAMELFRDAVPAAYGRHGILEKPFRHFLFYSDEEKQCFCTACGRLMELDDRKTKHNHQGRCPACHAEVTYRSSKTSRKSLCVPKWSWTAEKGRDGTLLFRYFRHARDLDDWKSPHYAVDEIYRAVVTEGRTSFFEKTDYKHLGLTGGWGYPIRHCFSAWASPSEWYEPYSLVPVQPKSVLKRMLKGTPWEYSGFECYAVLTDGKSHWPHAYPDRWKKTPCMEKVVKNGFIQIAEELITSSHVFEIDNDAPCTRDVLKLTGNEYILLSADPAGVTPSQVNTVRNFRKQMQREMTPAEFGIFMRLDSERMSHYGNPVADMLSVARRGVPVTKAYRYVTGQKATVHNYLDYIEELDTIGKFYAEQGNNVNLFTEFFLYPGDFQKNHVMRAAELKALRDEAERKRIEEFDAKLALEAETARREMQAFGKGIKVKSLFIRPIESLSDLDAEAMHLHHCVDSYKTRVMDGKTEIFFIRRTEKPDTPYFTMEWRDGAVAQVHGLLNCNPPADVRALVDVFAEFLLKNRPKAKEA